MQLRGLVITATFCIYTLNNIG